MKALELKIPPALLVLAFGFLMWLLDRGLPQYKQTGAAYEWLAIAVFVLAMLFVAAGIASFKSAKTTVDPTQPQKTTAMVTGGIYGYTRNPMYLGFFLMLLAYATKLANPFTLTLLPVFVAYMNQFQIKPEEAALDQLFGLAFTEYKRQVRRWI